MNDKTTNTILIDDEAQENLLSFEATDEQIKKHHRSKIINAKEILKPILKRNGLKTYDKLIETEDEEKNFFLANAILENKEAFFTENKTYKQVLTEEIENQKITLEFLKKEKEDNRKELLLFQLEPEITNNINVLNEFTEQINDNFIVKNLLSFYAIVQNNKNLINEKIELYYLNLIRQFINNKKGILQDTTEKTEKYLLARIYQVNVKINYNINEAHLKTIENELNLIGDATSNQNYIFEKVELLKKYIQTHDNIKIFDNNIVNYALYLPYDIKTAKLINKSRIRLKAQNLNGLKYYFEIDNIEPKRYQAQYNGVIAILLYIIKKAETDLQIIEDERLVKYILTLDYNDELLKACNQYNEDLQQPKDRAKETILNYITFWRRTDLHIKTKDALIIKTLIKNDAVFNDKDNTITLELDYFIVQDKLKSFYYQNDNMEKAEDIRNNVILTHAIKSNTTAFYNGGYADKWQSFLIKNDAKYNYLLTDEKNKSQHLKKGIASYTETAEKSNYYKLEDNGEDFKIKPKHDNKAERETIKKYTYFEARETIKDIDTIPFNETDFKAFLNKYDYTFTSEIDIRQKYQQYCTNESFKAIAREEAKKKDLKIKYDLNGILTLASKNNPNATAEENELIALNLYYYLKQRNQLLTTETKLNNLLKNFTAYKTKYKIIVDYILNGDKETKAKEMQAIRNYADSKFNLIAINDLSLNAYLSLIRDIETKRYKI